MKGTWQKLTLKCVCNSGEIGSYLYFSQYGVANFSTLKGYVLFAYPTYRIIIWDEINRKVSNTDKYNYFNYPNFSNEIFSTNKVSEAYETVKFIDPIYEQEIHHLGINSSLQTIFESTDSIMNSDLLRGWISNTFSEDTSYLPPKTVLKLSEIQNVFVGSRVNRWKYSFQIFSKEFNFRQKLTGGGFAFLSWFGNFFNGESLEQLIILIILYYLYFYIQE